MKALFAKLLFATFCTVFFMSPAPAFAESIRQFRTNITVGKDAVMRVEETIFYDFGASRRHGIYRDIPFVKKNSSGRKFRMDINVLSLADENGTSYRYSTSALNSDTLRIKIGDPDTYVTGERVYIITYEVKGAITYFSDHDELYWNMTGNSWEIPVEAASYEVRLPQEFSANQVKTICYTGGTGSTSQSCSSEYAQGVVRGSMTGALNVQEGLTAAVSFPMGAVAHLEPKEMVDFFDTLLGKAVLALLIIVGLVWYVLLPFSIPFAWYRWGRDPKAQIGEVRAWFDPPQARNGRSLGPGETGLLVDETVDMRDIFATIIDLARRGYFKITEEKEGDFYFEKSSTAEALGGKGGLQPYEKLLLDGLFEGGQKIRLKDQELVEVVANVQDNLYKSMTADGFFPQNPNTVRIIWIAIGAVALATGNLFLAVVSFIFGRSMPKKTAYGAGQANVGKSLKNFLASQERQLEFQAKNQMFFEKLLPYAIAFGVEKVWAQRFKDIALHSPDWYQGYNNRAFSTAYFMSSMNSSFNSFRSSATPTSSSSGFSSGFSGGSSGGGGGGGGGGSW